MTEYLSTALDFVSCGGAAVGGVTGLQAAFFGRALKATSGASNTPDSFVRTLVTGFAALWIVPTLFFNEAPGPGTNDLTLQCLLVAWVLYFYTQGMYRGASGSLFVYVLNVLFECMFVSHFIVKFTYQGAAASSSIICPLITGTLAGCATQLMRDGFKIFKDLLNPYTDTGLSFFLTVFVLVTGPKRSLWGLPVPLPLYPIPQQHQTLLLLLALFVASYFRGEGPCTVERAKARASPKSPKRVAATPKSSPKSPKRTPKK